MYRLLFKKHTAIFNEPGGTSRGVLKTKPSWIIKLSHPNYEKVGFGEISLIPGLSVETEEEVEQFLESNKSLSKERYQELLQSTSPAIRFGLEMALKSLESQALEMFGEKLKSPIKTNGLIWMGDFEVMKKRTLEKVRQGFECLKFKVGAHDFDEELAFLKSLRSELGSDLEIRLDANGAFSAENALEKLELLSQLNIHSIEQPIKSNQWKSMARLCKESPIDIALDEELIGIKDVNEKEAVLDEIKPQYIIFKNSLIGGWKEADEWILLAEQRNIKWWSTSALELNVGLNAIAYQLNSYKNELPQGLGTGKVFTNNLPCNFKLKGEYLIKESNEDLLFESCSRIFE